MSVQNTVLRALRPSCRLMSTKATPPTRSRSRYLWLSLLPIAAYFAWPSKRPLNPQVYTEQRVGDNKPLPGGRHSLLTIPVSEGAQFGPGAAAALGIGLPERTVLVQHVMVRSSALMIERPYTPVNDVDADGEARLVVKRVPGGEVGRMVHALVPGDNVGVRGPIATFALDPEAYDTVVMVSTGTAVAPFLQLLAKTPVESTSTRFRLLHAAPPRDPDWSTEFVAPLQQRWGSRLAVDRIQPGKIQRDDIARALDGAGRVLVMVCLPPNVMRPFCGPLTPTLEQGPLTGLLSDMGLQRNQVWKLE